MFHDPRVVRCRQIPNKFANGEVRDGDIHYYQVVEVCSFRSIVKSMELT